MIKELIKNPFKHEDYISDYDLTELPKMYFKENPDIDVLNDLQETIDEIRATLMGAINKEFAEVLTKISKSA
jgi:hypothetical protein